MKEAQVRAALFFLHELWKASAKHPEFPVDEAEGLAIITEEYLEAVRSINDQDTFAQRMEEVAHVAVTAFRMLVAMEEQRFGADPADAGKPE